MRSQTQAPLLGWLKSIAAILLLCAAVFVAMVAIMELGASGKSDYGWLIIPGAFITMVALITAGLFLKPEIFSD